MTLITLRFAKRLGLVNFDGRPTQATSRVTKVRGVVAGASAEYSVIIIQYTIKGSFVCQKRAACLYFFVILTCAYPSTLYYKVCCC